MGLGVKQQRRSQPLCMRRNCGAKAAEHRDRNHRCAKINTEEDVNQGNVREHWEQEQRT
jgi:hypothetical protein